mgnify:FL=1
MNRTKLKLIMSILMIMGVYIAVYICLPANRAKVASNIFNIISMWNNEGSNSDNSTNDNTENIDMSNKRIVIDSGHGGIDPGKKSDDGILEKDVNLAIAFKLKKRLEAAGISVTMTRSDENGLYQESDSNKKIADMKKRCSIIEESNANAVISIHQNSFQSSSVKGAQVFYYKHSVQGKLLAECIQNSFRQNIDETNKREAKADTTYYMLIHTKVPTVIAECGFLSNPEEAQLLVTEEYQEKVALALYNGIIDYLMHTGME